MEVLKRYLSEHDMSQSDLAQQLGVKQPSVWGWLNGRSSPSAERLKDIARVTGLSIDQLLASPESKIEPRVE